VRAGSDGICPLFKKSEKAPGRAVSNGEGRAVSFRLRSHVKTFEPFGMPTCDFLLILRREFPFDCFRICWRCVCLPACLPGMKNNNSVMHQTGPLRARSKLCGCVLALFCFVLALFWSVLAETGGNGGFLWGGIIFPSVINLGRKNSSC